MVEPISGVRLGLLRAAVLGGPVTASAAVAVATIGVAGAVVVVALYVALLLLFVGVAWTLSIGLGWLYGDEALITALIVTAVAGVAVLVV